MALKIANKIELSPADLTHAEHEIAAITKLKLHWHDAPDADLELMMTAF